MCVVGGRGADMGAWSKEGQWDKGGRVLDRVVTIRYPQDTIRIAILESRYDTYRDTW